MDGSDKMNDRIALLGHFQEHVKSFRDLGDHIEFYHRGKCVHSRGTARSCWVRRSTCSVGTGGAPFPVAAPWSPRTVVSGNFRARPSCYWWWEGEECTWQFFLFYYI